MNRLYKVCREFDFEAAHRLYNNYEGPCKTIHGHTYVCTICVNSRHVNSTGMVVDFGRLKEFEQTIKKDMDHSLILCNSDPLALKIDSSQPCFISYQKTFVLPKIYTNTTCENFCEYIGYSLFDYFNWDSNIESVDIKIYETRKNSVSCHIENMKNHK